MVRRHSEETKNKIRKGLLGHSVSKETRKKISLSQLGKKQSLELIEKRVNGRKGYKHSKKTVEKIRKGNLGKIVSKETKEKIKQKLLGTKLSKEHKLKISNSSKGRIVSKETRKKISDSNKKYFNTEEMKKITSKRHKGRKRTLVTREKIRKSQIKRIERQFFNGEPLTPCIGLYETALLDYLEDIFGHKIFRQYRANGYFIDGFCPAFNLAIEIDEPIHKKKKVKDMERQKYIQQSINCNFLRLEVP